MKKLLIVMKIALKQMAATLPLMLLMYVIFPAGLVFFLGGTFAIEKGNEVEKIRIMIEDADNTVASKGLSDFFESEVMSEQIEIEDSDKSHVVNIPKGYENALWNNLDFEIKLEEEKNQGQGKAVEQIINNYHKQINLMEEGISEDEINLLMFGNVAKIVESDVKKEAKDMGPIAASFIVMIVAMFIGQYSQARCMKFTETLNIRENSTPNSKYTLVFYEIAVSGVVLVIMMSIYIAIFRITGNGFTGNLAIIGLLSLITCIFGIAILILMKVLIPKKIGAGAGMIIMLVTMLGSFGGSNDILNAITKFNPFDSISNMFTCYEVHADFALIKGDILNTIAIIFIMGLVTALVLKRKRVVE